MSGNRSSWKSNIGFLLAAIGSAIGLGNVWRFSYMAHEYGGGAFLIPYLVALVVAGVPIMIIEYGLGHREKSSSPLSFIRINKRFEWLGWWMPVVAIFGIMLYYSVIIGWCINYLFYSFSLAWGSDTQAFFFSQFLQLTDSAAELGGIRMPIVAATLFVWILCWLICYRDIGWIVKATVLREHVSRLGTKIPAIWDIMVKFVTPLILIYLLYLSIKSDLTENYSGYSTDQLIIYGVGWLLVCLLVALGLTFAPWKEEKLKRRHKPEEDELLV